MSDSSINALSSTTDGRTNDLRYRQRQFLSLHLWMTAHSSKLMTAAQKDDNLTPNEARYLLTLALENLRRTYDSLNLKKELRDEYRIKRNQSSSGRSVAEERIHVIPSPRLLVFNVLHVLYPCLAAGCCCVIELPEPSESQASVLRELFDSSLDRAAFRVISQRPSADALAQFVVVDQIGTELSPSPLRRVASEVDGVSSVIVDRTADLTLAAREILKSRTAFAACQTYAPTYVLVNEFIEEELLALLRNASSVQAENRACSTSLPVFNGNTKTVFECEKLRVQKVSERTQLRACRKRPDAKSVLLLSTSSHDDAIDALNATEQSPLLALYVFADPPAAKYLSQFVHTRVSFVNQIPTHILAWPAAPQGYRFDPMALYRREMFERPSPQFVNGSFNDVVLDALHSPNSSGLEDQYSSAARPLKATGQAREGEADFFSRALIIGVLCYVVLPVVGVIGGLTMVTKWRWGKGWSK